MKARKIKKIRKIAKYYKVMPSWGLFGDFTKRNWVTVLALNHHNACQRAKKRGHGLDHTISYFPKDRELFAHWKVIEDSKPMNHRFFKFY